jgi:hypothetical protein
VPFKHSTCHKTPPLLPSEIDYLQQGLKAEQHALAEQQEDEQARLQLISETRKFLSDAAKLVGDGEEAQEITYIGYLLYLR